MTAAAVDAYITTLPPDQAHALADLPTPIAARPPAHPQSMSCAMPGSHQPGPKGKMVVGYAASACHLGLYSHTGNTISRLDCAPFKTSEMGVLFIPAHPLPASLVHQIIDLRLTQPGLGY